MTDLSELGLLRLPFRPGSKVGLVGSGGLQATVLVVNVYHGRTLYNCAWWKDGERKECWLEDFEIEAVA